MGSASSKSRKGEIAKENVLPKPKQGPGGNESLTTMSAELCNLAGVNFDMSGFLNKKAINKPDLNGIMPVVDVRKNEVEAR